MCGSTQIDCMPEAVVPAVRLRQSANDESVSNQKAVCAKRHMVKFYSLTEKGLLRACNEQFLQLALPRRGRRNNNERVEQAEGMMNAMLHTIWTLSSFAHLKLESLLSESASSAVARKPASVLCCTGVACAFTSGCFGLCGLSANTACHGVSCSYSKPYSSFSRVRISACRHNTIFRMVQFLEGLPVACAAWLTHVPPLLDAWVSVVLL